MAIPVWYSGICRNRSCLIYKAPTPGNRGGETEKRIFPHYINGGSRNEKATEKDVSVGVGSVSAGDSGAGGGGVGRGHPGGAGGFGRAGVEPFPGRVLHPGNGGGGHRPLGG